MINILVVEDDKNLRKLIRVVLEQNGYTTFTARNGEEALLVLDKCKVDLIICDVMMPIIDGYQLTKELRDASYDMPIIMVTAKETIADKREGFNVGADDYMVKPIDLDEMLLRINALLRRYKIINEHVLSIGDTRLDYDGLSLNHRGNDIDIPKKEFLILFKLLSYPKTIFTRQQLMDDIWGMDSETDERTVDVHIRRLREKVDYIEDFSIVTVRGLGYKAMIK